MTSPNVQLNIAKGSINAETGVWTAPTATPQAGASWVQAKELAAGKTQSDWNVADWTVPSAYGYYYWTIPASGGNGKAGGEIGIPTQTADFDWTVSPHGNDAIDHVSCKDATSPSHYTVTGPDTKKAYTITETEHAPDTDHFYVWGHAVTGGTNGSVILCDPIIRNRGG